MPLSREELRARILAKGAAKADLSEPVFDDPEIDNQIHIRELTGEETVSFRQVKNAAGEWDENAANGIVFTTALLDKETGLPIYGAKDAQQVMRELGMSKIKPIVDQILQLSKLGKAQVVAAKNVSDPTQKSDSSSNSLSGSDAPSENSSLAAMPAS